MKAGGEKGCDVGLLESGPAESRAQEELFKAEDPHHIWGRIGPVVAVG